MRILLIVAVALMLGGCNPAFLQGMSQGFYRQTNPRGYYNEQALEYQRRQAEAMERIDRLQRYGF